MNLPLSIATLGLDAVAACVLLYWAVGLFRLIVAARSIPTARDGVALARAHPCGSSVCVIVPAHNEEAVISGLIGSLRAQTHARFAVVLCLDRCVDRTRERALGAIAGDPRFSILDVQACPPGWAGKVNAVWQGARSATACTADLLLFVDADTVLDPECIAAAAALLEHRKLALVSLLSTLTSRRWFELVVQPAATMELIRQYPIARANRLVGRRAFANGQFMLFERRAYEAIGGHEAVKDELLEDLALARRMSHAGHAAGLFVADGMLACRMYDSWTAFRNGWKRIFTESTHRKVERLNKAAVCNAIMGSFLPVLVAVNLALCAVWLARDEPLSILAVVGVSISSAALTIWFIVVGATYRITRVPLWAVPGFALGSWLVGVILAEAARDLRRGATTTWAGRTYVRTPR